jgi:hypothetical protein
MTEKFIYGNGEVRDLIAEIGLRLGRNRVDLPLLLAHAGLDSAIERDPGR